MTTVNRNSVYPFVPVNKEDFSKALHRLKTRLPRSCHVYNMLLSQSRFPDRINIYTFKGAFGENAWIIVISYREDMGTDINISVPKEPEITDELTDALSNSGLIDWDNPYLFSATDRNISRMILEISGYVKGNSSRIIPCYLYYAEPGEALAYEIEKPGEGELRGLSVESGTEFLRRHWKHSRAGTKDYLQVLISKHDTLGIYIGNKPVCGLITHINGTMGMLNTADEHRRKGYAQICMKALIKELAQNGFVPCSAAEIPNKASQGLHEKIGMKVSHVVDYIGCFGV